MAREVLLLPSAPFPIIRVNPVIPSDILKVGKAVTITLSLASRDHKSSSNVMEDTPNSQTGKKVGVVRLPPPYVPNEPIQPWEERDIQYKKQPNPHLLLLSFYGDKNLGYWKIL